MKDIQQLIKKNSQEGKYENIFPKTFIDAVLDKESGVTLTDILAMFNMLFLSYNGSRSQTRLQVPSSFRRQGLWVTYVLYDKTVVTEWYSAEAIDDTTFGDSANWRDGSNALVGDISISSDGYRVINGEFTNSLHIKGYVATVGALPSTAVQGDIYGVGPTYDTSDTEHTNPIYQLYVKNSTGWVDNGKFTSIAAGVVQDTGNSETAVMSQKAVTNSLSSNYKNFRGTTDSRPTLTEDDSGFPFYDTTLKKYICWDGDVWTNFDGSALT